MEKKINYKISFEEMSKRNKENLSKQPLTTLVEAREQVRQMNEGILLEVSDNISPIEFIAIKSFRSLDIDLLKELPDKDKIIYNDISYKEDLIAELKFDFSKIKYSGKLPFNRKIGKCNFCYPKNKTYTFHNPESDELIFRCVVDKVDDENYIVMVCENKPKSKSPSINNDYPF